MATPSAPINATTNATAKGTVVFVQGEAFLRDASGRTILDNLQRCPALAGAITIIKPGPSELLGHPCV